MPLPKPKLPAGWRRAKLIALINELDLSFRGCGTCGVVVNALALSTNPQAGPLRYSLAFHLRRSKKPNSEPKLRPPAVSKSLTRSIPRKSLHPLHAPSTPVAVCPVIRPLTDLSQKGFTLLVLTTLASLRRVFEGFTFVRLSDAHLHEIDLALFLQRSPPRLFTAAAWSGLGPAPENRSRGANPHLSRSLSTRLVSP